MYKRFLKSTTHFQSFGNILSVLTHCLPPLLHPSITNHDSCFCSIPSFTTFVVISLAGNSISTTSIVKGPFPSSHRSQSDKQFRLLITPRLQSPILPLPTRHSLALNPTYHHSLIHSTFSFHSHILILTIQSPLPYQTARSFPCEHSIHPGKHW